LKQITLGWSTKNLMEPKWVIKIQI
jgi:hypothetical protein